MQFQFHFEPRFDYDDTLSLALSQAITIGHRVMSVFPVQAQRERSRLNHEQRSRQSQRVFDFRTFCKLDDLNLRKIY